MKQRKAEIQGRFRVENEAQGIGAAPIVLVDKRRWMRLPEESAQAYAAVRAYLDAGPGQRSIAQAYRQLKGMPDGAPVKVPGYINAWAKQYSWAERAAAWDAHVESLAELHGLGPRSRRSGSRRPSCRE